MCVIYGSSQFANLLGSLMFTTGLKMYSSIIECHMRPYLMLPVANLQI